jgi:acetyl-CoA acetyltransferase
MSPTRSVAVAGVATTDYGAFPETDATGLAVRALSDALADAGLQRQNVDGLITSRVPSHPRFCELAGIDPHFVLQLPAYGRLTGVAIKAAIDAVLAGHVEVVALAYGNDGRSKRVHYGGGDSEEEQTLWHAWGMTSPGAQHALMFQRHNALHGTTTEQLGEISVAFRHHASLNESAVMRKPITLEDHHKSRFIVAPLRLLDYCLINDGGVALVITTSERARACRRPPVEVLAAATAGELSQTSFPPEDFWHAPLAACAAESYGSAGIAPDDVDTAQIYDNFTPTVVFTLEGLGFCERGEGGSFVENGALSLRGRLPSNTSGGHLSESYMQGWALNVEAVRQLRGEAGARQVPDCEIAQYAAAAPLCSSIIYAIGR